MGRRTLVGHSPVAVVDYMPVTTYAANDVLAEDRHDFRPDPGASSLVYNEL